MISAGSRCQNCVLSLQALSGDGGAAAAGAWRVGATFQLERVGFVVVDPDTTQRGGGGGGGGGLVLTLTCALRAVGGFGAADAPADAGAVEKLDARKAAQAQQLADKAAKAKLDPAAMFRGATGIASLDEEYKGKFSKFDEHGVPTHDGVGEPLPKNKIKGLQKDWKKQKALFEKGPK